MFRVELPRAGDLQHLCEVLSAYDEASWELTEEGVYVFSMDGARVAVCELRLPASGLDEYIIDKPHTLGISSKVLAELLKQAPTSGKGVGVALCNSDKRRRAALGPDHVVVELTGEAAWDLSWNMVLLDIDAERLSIPPTEWEAEVTMPPSVFTNVCKALMAVGDTVSAAVSHERESIVLETTGAGNSARIELRDKSPPGVELRLDENVEFSMDFGLAHLSQFAKAGSCSKCVRMCLKEDIPALFEFDLPSMPGARLSFWLAPKIRNEDF